MLLAQALSSLEHNGEDGGNFVVPAAGEERDDSAALGNV